MITRQAINTVLKQTNKGLDDVNLKGSVSGCFPCFLRNGMSEMGMKLVLVTRLVLVTGWTQFNMQDTEPEVQVKHSSTCVTQ